MPGLLAVRLYEVEFAGAITSIHPVILSRRRAHSSTTRRSRMAIAFRASAEAHVTTGSLTLTIPAGVQAGDLLLVVGAMNNGGNASYDWATPSGWTKKDDRSVGSNFYGVVYSKVAVSGDAGATLTLASSNTGKSCGVVAAYSGCDQGTPIDVLTGASETTAATAHTTPTVVSTQDQDWVIIAAAQSNSVSETWSTPSGYTKRQDSLDNVSLSGHCTATLQDKGPESVGTYGGEALNASGASNKAAMWTIAISPQQSTQTSRPTSDIDVTNAVGVPTPGGGSGVYANLAANDDAHYAEISNSGDVEVGMAALIDPLSASSHTVSYRARYAGGATSGTVTTTLKQGVTTIASWTDTLTASFQTFSHTLNSTQANSITDYSALRLRHVAAVS
jgi:hypothetical protein